MLLLQRTLIITTKNSLEPKSCFSTHFSPPPLHKVTEYAWLQLCGESEPFAHDINSFPEALSVFSREVGERWKAHFHLEASDG
jgi:hypothetical protein